MNKKQLLTGILIGLMITGFATWNGLFVSYSLPNAKQEHDAWKACDLSSLAPGETKKCNSDTMVYRRTELDKNSIAKFEYLLADPLSQNSEQPEAAKNQWRSENPEFFVFREYAPVRLCSVKLMPSDSRVWDDFIEEKVALEKLPYFTEPCESRAWDTSGRLYKRSGYPPEKNLNVPKVKWLFKNSLLIYN